MPRRDCTDDVLVGTNFAVFGWPTVSPVSLLLEEIKNPDSDAVGDPRRDFMDPLTAFNGKLSTAAVSLATFLLVGIIRIGCWSDVTASPSRDFTDAFVVDSGMITAALGSSAACLLLVEIIVTGRKDFTDEGADSGPPDPDVAGPAFTAYNQSWALAVIFYLYTNTAFGCYMK